jgi:hypothetical protein
MSLFLISHHIAAVVQNCEPSRADESGCQTTFPQPAANAASVKIALQLVFGVIGVATVIYIIISALRYQASLGDPQATAKLRNAIIYAAIGLVIAVSAELLVTFTLGRL